ncbi:MAG: TolC family outer membrane protein [Magnetococcales bacterium]|nr:TolC family outer membrane protein [Magnetococcales bacterium]
MKMRFNTWHGWTLLGLAAALALAQPGAALNLPDAVSRAVTTNPEARAALENHHAVEQGVQAARAGYLPTVDLSTALGREYSDNPTTRGAGEQGVGLNRGESGIKLSQMLFDGQATRSGVAASASRAAAAGFGYDQVAESVALAAAEAYLDVLKQRELLQLASDNVALHKRILTQVRGRVTSGSGNEADIQQTESRLALADATMSALEGSLENALSRYYQVVGEAPTGLIPPVQHAERLPRTLEDALRDALANHPAILIATRELEAAQAQQEGAKSGYWPKVNLEMSANANDNVGGVAGYAKAMAALLRLDYNIFRGGGDDARKEEALRRGNQAREQLELARRHVEEGVRIAWKAYLVSQSRISHLERHQAVSKKVAAAYHEQFQKGHRSLVDVLNAENESMSARSALRTEQYTLMASSCRLMAAVGHLRTYLEIPPVQVASASSSWPTPAGTAVSASAESSSTTTEKSPATDNKGVGTAPSRSTGGTPDYLPPTSRPPDGSPAYRPATSRTSAHGRGEYALLLGAFTSRDNVNRLRERLEQAGFPSFERSSISNGRHFFRVYCGPYPTPTEAQGAAGRLLKKVGMEVKVVKEKENRDREEEDALRAAQPTEDGRLIAPGRKSDGRQEGSSTPGRGKKNAPARENKAEERTKAGTGVPEVRPIPPEPVRESIPTPMTTPPTPAAPPAVDLSPVDPNRGGFGNGEPFQKPAPEPELPKSGTKTKKEPASVGRRISPPANEVDLPESGSALPGQNAGERDKRPSEPPAESGQEKSEEWFSSPSHPVEIPEDMGRSAFPFPEDRAPTSGEVDKPPASGSSTTPGGLLRGKNPWKRPGRGTDPATPETRKGGPDGTKQSEGVARPARGDEDGRVDMAPGPSVNPPRGGEGKHPDTKDKKGDDSDTKRAVDQELRKWFQPGKEKGQEGKPSQPGSSLQPGTSPQSEGPPTGGYSVFLGSFSVPRLAEMVSDRTRQSGLPVYQQTTMTQGHPAVRIYAGPFPREEMAQAALRRMQKEQDLTDGFVVKNGAGGMRAGGYERNAVSARESLPSDNNI